MEAEIVTSIPAMAVQAVRLTHIEGRCSEGCENCVIDVPNHEDYSAVEWDDCNLRLYHWCLDKHVIEIVIGLVGGCLIGYWLWTKGL